jgi:FkbM family methyltransferase
MSFSIQFGNFLYKNAFPVYNFLYPRFKRKQDTKEIRLIESIVKPGDSILDIGANIGFYTTLFSKLVGEKGAVLAFEPEPLNFKYLNRNCDQLRNVKLINKAVSDTTGTLKIYLSKMLNVDHRTYKIEDYSEVKEIDSTTIDDYLKTYDCPKIDFIKMDIQGFEMAALKGMINTLKNNSKIKVISELWPYGLQKAGSSVLEVLSFLNAEGFNIYLLSSMSVQLITPEKAMQLHVDEKVYYNIYISREKEVIHY